MMNAFELIDGGEGNVYHFLFYMIGKFILVDGLDKIIYYYPNKKNCKVSEDFLKMLPDKYERHLVKKENINYQQLPYLPFFVDSVLPDEYFFLRRLFNKYISHTIDNNKFIYISRNKGKNYGRKILNEDILWNILDKINFKKVYLEDLTIKEQIEIFSTSKIIVSPHGGGLSHSIFSHSNQTIICEINPNSPNRGHFKHICESMKIPYYRFEDCETIMRTEPGSDHTHFDYVINPVKFIEFMIKIMSLIS